LPTPAHALYMADFVDFFSLIIAINLGGIAGAIFTLFCNIASRAVGITPPWAGVMKDAVSQAVVCLFIAPIHYATGGNIFVSMMIYTGIRFAGFVVLRIIFPYPYNFVQWVFVWSGALASSIIINGLYASIFGNFFNNLLQAGVQFPWILFLISSLIIGGSMFYLKTISMGDLKKVAKHAVALVPKKNLKKINTREFSQRTDDYQDLKKSV